MFLNFFSIVVVLGLLALRMNSDASVRAQATDPFQVIATIPVGLAPTGIAVNEVTNRIYVTNYIDNTVSVIDGSTNIVIATIPVGLGPSGIGVNPITNKVYVANHNAGSPLSVINGATNTVVDEVPVDINAFGVGVNPTSNRIYVTVQPGISNGPYVNVIDGATNSIVSTINCGIATDPVRGTSGRYCDPSQVVADPTTSKVYVHDYNGMVVVIDNTDTVISGITGVGGGSNSFALGINSQSRRLYVGSSILISGILSVINLDTQETVADIQLPFWSTVRGIGTNVNVNHTYISMSPFLVLDGATSTFLGDPLPISGGAVAVNQVTNRAYAVNSNDNTVIVIDDSEGAPPPGYLHVFVEVAGNFYSIDESSNHIAIDGQRYASLPLRVRITRHGQPVSNAIVSITSSPFEKILGITDSYGLVESSVDSIPPVTSNNSPWNGSQKIVVAATDALGNGSSGEVEVYTGEIISSNSFTLTYWEALSLGSMILGRYALRNGADSFLCDFTRQYVSLTAYTLCTLHDLVRLATEGYVNHDWQPREGDQVDLVLYQFKANGMDERFFTRVTVSRLNETIYNDLSWWTENQDLYNFNTLPDRRMVGAVAASPITFYITNPNGESSGTVPNTGMLVFNFDMAISEKGDEPYMALIPSPFFGAYTFSAVGTDNGEYGITFSTINENGELSSEYSVSGSTVPGQITDYQVIYFTSRIYLPLISK
jgi:YVTN family beta-propeller protein